MKRNILTITRLVLLLMVTITGCSRADSLLSITVAPNQIMLLSGGMQPLSVNASFKSGTIKEVANWTCSSSNPAVAVTDKTGYIKAIATGSTNLTVSYKENGITKEVTVPVYVSKAPQMPATYYVSE